MENNHIKYTKQVSSKINLLFVAFFIFINASTYAQKVVFTVTAVKGYAKLDETALKVGAKLKNNQTLKVNADTYLCLATNDHQVLEITSQGTYVVKDLLSKIPARQDLNSSYVQFVVGEITKATEDGVSAKNRFQHMNKTGAIKRSLNQTVNFFLENIKTDNGHILYGHVLELAWQVKQDEGTDTIRRFQISILHLNGFSVFKQVVGTTEMSIDLSNVDLKGQDGFMVQVIPLDNKGKYWGKDNVYELYINLLDEKQKQEVSEKISKGNTAIDRLMDARYFESEKLYPDAIRAYKEAIRLSEGSPIYEDLYYSFLLRNTK